MCKVRPFTGGRKAYRMTMLYCIENVVLKSVLVDFPHLEDNGFDR